MLTLRRRTGAATDAGVGPGAPSAGAAIEVDDLSVMYSARGSGPAGRGTLAVSGMTFDVEPGESVVILGPSGCGKSTLLKVMAGLLEPSSGSVAVGNEADRIGFVFQSDALMPWRTAVQNVELAVLLRGGAPGDARDSARELMDELGLADACDRYPAELSGGMRKRVSLARALAYQPSVLFMDEPFGPLDAQTRIKVGNFFLRLIDRYRQTVVFVTHDIDEAITLADRIIVMSARPGRVAATIPVGLARPRDYYETRFDDGFTELQRAVWEVIS